MSAEYGSTYLRQKLATKSCNFRERIDLLSRELPRCEVAVLAAQVAGLARLGLAGIANGHLAALVRVEMGTGGSAVAVLRDWLLVEVVHEGTASGWEAAEGDTEQDTDAIGSGDGGDGAAERAALLDRQGSDVAGAGWVTSNLRRGAGLSAHG
jgi:hypothetical protein